jgi:hypothetical protein
MSCAGALVPDFVSLAFPFVPFVEILQGLHQAEQG